MKLPIAFVLAVCAGCASGPNNGEPPPSLEGPYACGGTTCTTGQVCMTMSAGSQCQVNDAGIDQYEVYDWACVDLPAKCDGRLTCDCFSGSSVCNVSEDGRTIDFGCI